MKRLFRTLFLVFLFSLALTQGVNPGLAATVVNYGTEGDDSQVNLGGDDPDAILRYSMGRER